MSEEEAGAMDKPLAGVEGEIFDSLTAGAPPVNEAQLAVVEAAQRGDKAAQEAAPEKKKRGRKPGQKNASVPPSGEAPAGDTNQATAETIQQLKQHLAAIALGSEWRLDEKAHKGDGDMHAALVAATKAYLDSHGEVQLPPWAALVVVEVSYIARCARRSGPETISRFAKIKFFFSQKFKRKKKQNAHVDSGHDDVGENHAGHEPGPREP